MYIYLNKFCVSSQMIISLIGFEWCLAMTKSHNDNIISILAVSKTSYNEHVMFSGYRE